MTASADTFLSAGEERLDIYSSWQRFYCGGFGEFWEVANDCQGGSTHMQHGAGATREW